MDEPKVRIKMKDLPVVTAEMMEELKRRAMIPNPNRHYPELPEWRTFEVSVDEFVAQHNVPPFFDEGGQPGDPPAPLPFPIPDWQYHEPNYCKCKVPEMFWGKVCYICKICQKEVNVETRPAVSYGPRCWWCAELMNDREVCCKPEDRLT